MKISVVGLGKLGAPLAALLAAKGHDVIGADVNQGPVDAVNAGAAPVEEPGLQECMERGQCRLSATTDVAGAAARTDVTFVIVPTPSTEIGIFTSEFVLSAMDQIGAGIHIKSSYHVVVVTSTVMPGQTGGPIRERLEAASGRTVGTDLGLCYNPEFIALGSVLNDMLHPDFILIGESDPQAGAVMSAIHESVCENNPPMRRMNFVNAELTKIAVNTFVTTKISYANMLGDICDRLPGADVHTVTAALGTDTRIGGRYLKAATAYGGPCFPRDNLAFSALARSLGARPDLAEATDRINDYQVERLAALVESKVEPGASVAVLGLSYKPNTPVIEESIGISLASLLASYGYAVSVYDPMAMPAAERKLKGTVKLAPSMADCVSGCDAVVIATPWPEFEALNDLDLSGTGRRVTIIDCWQIISTERSSRSFEVVELGRFPAKELGDAYRP